MQSRAWRVAMFATLAVALAAAGMTTFATGRFTWGQPEIPKAQGEALRADTILRRVKNLATLRYRDRVAAAIIREPRNTWSNLPFVFVGALIAAHDRRVLSRFLGAALISLGLASGLYHASLRVSWRTVDVATMGWVIFALGLLGLSAVWDNRPGVRPLLAGHPSRQFCLSVIGGSLALIAAVFRNDVRIAGVKPFDSTYVTVGGVTFVFLLLITGTFLCPRKPSIARLGALALVTAVAIVCQLWDHPGYRFFQPDSLIQAHAVWHVLMAFAAALTYDLFLTLEGRPTLWSRPT